MNFHLVCAFITSCVSESLLVWKGIFIAILHSKSEGQKYDSEYGPKCPSEPREQTQCPSEPRIHWELAKSSVFLQVLVYLHFRVPEPLCGPRSFGQLGIPGS